MTGVTFDKRSGRWRADFFGNGKRLYLGLFSTQKEAEKRLLKAKKIAAPYLRETVRSDNKTGHPGISYSAADKKYRVRLKGKHLGMFATLTEAVAAQSKAKIKEGVA